MMFGIDIDGVLVPEGGWSKLFIVRLIANLFLFTPLGKWLYLKRKPNKKVVSWIKKRKARGEVIVFISDTWEVHRRIVEKLLKSWQIPVDSLVLSIPFFFPVKTAKLVVRWQRLIEDNPDIVRFLVQKGNCKARKIGDFFVIRRRSR